MGAGVQYHRKIIRLQPLLGARARRGVGSGGGHVGSGGERHRRADDGKFRDTLQRLRPLVDRSRADLAPFGKRGERPRGLRLLEKRCDPNTTLRKLQV